MKVVQSMKSMIKLEDSETSFYFCQSANWQAVVEAENKVEASIKALKETLETLGRDTLISPCMMVRKIKEGLEDSDVLFRIDHILADLGMHKEARALEDFLESY